MVQTGDDEGDLGTMKFVCAIKAIHNLELVYIINVLFSLFEKE